MPVKPAYVFDTSVTLACLAAYFPTLIDTNHLQSQLSKLPRKFMQGHRLTSPLGGVCVCECVQNK